MDTLDYFRLKAEAYISPMGILELKKSSIPHVLVDVRITGDRPLDRIPDSISIPVNEIRHRMGDLPKETIIVVYCWDTWCSLATKAAIPLLEEGFKVKELYGGVAAWRALAFFLSRPQYCLRLLIRRHPLRADRLKRICVHFPSGSLGGVDRKNRDEAMNRSYFAIDSAQHLQTQRKRMGKG